ncbi:MAG: class A beta-lactamase [Solirubrobacterales bacterium]|nr:class A beta-lactamase [Solirubrobacterales bacterium]
MPDDSLITRRQAIGGGLAATAGVATLAISRAAAGQLAPGSVDSCLARLEHRHGARVGVYAVNHHSGARFGYRASERFAFCSVYKAPLVARVLRDFNRDGFLDRLIHYDHHDLIEGDFVTKLYVDTGMTVRSLCAAALANSDNVAANLLLRLTGGPAGLQHFLRSIGDRVTLVEHNEPSVNTAVPGQRRDTTTPQAIAEDFTRLLLGDTLPAFDRQQLRLWMQDDMVNTTRFRAAVPASWQIADKTGTGSYGTANDVGVLWSSRGTPLTVAVLTTKSERQADPDAALVAAATRLAVKAVS